MEDVDRFSQLPEECISRIIALTTAKDACRAAAASRIFKSIANSDHVWEARLPSNIDDIISQSKSPSLNSLSRKDLYLSLSHRPLLIGTGNTSFGLERESGKVCYMRGARDLKIIWSVDTPEYWYWESDPRSRFCEVAKLNRVWWLEIEGRIEARKLSPRTKYAGYFVFKLSEDEQEFDRKPVTLRVYFKGAAEMEEGKRVMLHSPAGGASAQIQQRRDGWMEVHMGEIFNDSEDDASIIFSLHELVSRPYEGLIVEGIEIRPAN